MLYFLMANSPSRYPDHLPNVENPYLNKWQAELQLNKDCQGRPSFSFNVLVILKLFSAVTSGQNPKQLS